MKLYILRHGEAAEHSDPRFKNDADRPLTPNGIRRTKQLAHSLRQLEVSFDVIFSSPLVRARETAEIVERGLRLLADG
jgi:phosphohistidine phosphatase